MELEEFLNKLQDITGIPAKSQCLKVVEENLIRRVDRQIYNKENPTVKNTLKDLKIMDNSAILLEVIFL